MDNKKKRNYFMITVKLLFIIFIFVYIIGESGYHEASIRNDTILTEEAINRFEEDVLNGEEVDVKNYVEKEIKDYSNGFTKAGEKINNGVITIITDGALELVNVFKYLFT